MTRSRPITFAAAAVIQRVVLTGAACRGGGGAAAPLERGRYALATRDKPTAEDLLGLFFSSSEQSRAKGMESIGPTRGRP
ncbi:MAG: hypothetical protein QOJ18_832 [Microbacteriaceae bacterium]|nr:hypothetical protein [Microbacteriaceae bacterium]